MIARAFGTGFLFGALGGVILGLSIGVPLMREEGWESIGTPVGMAMFGVLYGVPIAVFSSVLGALAGAGAGRRRSGLARPIGTAVAFLATAGMVFGIQGGIGPALNPMIVGPALFAAIVAWFRLPWIHAGGRRDTLAA